MSALLLVALVGLGLGVPVEISPPRPTVGDPITIVFPEAEGGTIRVEESSEYEIISVEGNRAVVRSFRPGEISVKGDVHHGRDRYSFPGLEITIESVLEENDALEPAPLRPPADLPANRAAWWSIGIALTLAALLWALVARMREPPAAADAGPPRAAPATELLQALEAARRLEPAAARIAVGSAAREFLSRIRPEWSLDLTSRELRRALADGGVPEQKSATIAALLREADLEKFSPWGAAEDRDALIEAARSLVDLDRVSET